jgi:hypothetical protein
VRTFFDAFDDVIGGSEYGDVEYGDVEYGDVEYGLTRPKVLRRGGLRSARG